MITEVISSVEKKAASLAADTARRLKELSITVALAESCTAGLVAALLANTDGASSLLWGSYVCYAREAKVSMLGLDDNALSAYGLVSGETASLMVKAALERSGADMAVSVTGLAGPRGDGRVPVGTVWAAAGFQNAEARVKKFYFEGERNIVRFKAAAAALELALGVVDIKYEK